MNLRIIFTLAFVLTFSAFASSQETTKLEEFSSKTGVVTLVEYSSGPRIPVLGGSFEVQIRKVGSVNKPGSTKGIQIKVNRGQYTGVAFIDLDEIEDLIDGVEYISKATKEVTDLESFEAIFVQ